MHQRRGSPTFRNLVQTWSVAFEVLVSIFIFLNGVEVASAAPSEITIGGLFPLIWAEEAECAAHMLAAADRINNKTDGYLDHLLPEVRLQLVIIASRGPSRIESLCNRIYLYRAV
jgi:hypothetical protein